MPGPAKVLKQCRRTWFMRLHGGHWWFNELTAESFGVPTLSLVLPASPLSLSSAWHKLLLISLFPAAIRLAHWGKPLAPCSSSYSWEYAICGEGAGSFVSASDTAPPLTQFYTSLEVNTVLIPSKMMLCLFLSESKVRLFQNSQRNIFIKCWVYL